MRHGLQGYAGQRPTGHRDRRPGRPVVAVVGAGAAGTLTAIHLVDRAARERRALDIVLLDPRPDIARGVAYSTTDQRHLLNVPAGGMSALPAEPGHLVDWLRAHGRPEAGPADFVPRAEYGRYLDETLTALVDGTPDVACEHRCQRVTSARPVPGGVHLVLADGAVLAADAVVLAPGIFAPGTAWAPAELRGSARFVADPWAPGALDALDRTDGDVLLVGTGLTMVDVALTLARPGRTLHAVSRRGRVPAAHTTRPKPPTPAASPELAELAAGLAPTDLATMRRLVRDCVTSAVRETGDWRPAFDTLRPLTATSGPGSAPTSAPTSSPATRPGGTCTGTGCRRPRLPRSRGCAPPAPCRSAPTRSMRSTRRPTASPCGSRPAAGSTSQRSSTAPARRATYAGWPTRCSTTCSRPGTADGRLDGPRAAHRRRPARRLDRVGRVPRSGRSARCDAASCGRRTAVPEIRSQAADVAAAVTDGAAPGAPAVRHLSRDLMGLPLTHDARRLRRRTTAGLDAVMRVQSGAVEALHRGGRARPRLRPGARGAGDAGPRGRRRRRRPLRRWRPRASRYAVTAPTANAAWSTWSAPGSATAAAAAPTHWCGTCTHTRATCSRSAPPCRPSRSPG